MSRDIQSDNNTQHKNFIGIWTFDNGTEGLDLCFILMPFLMNRIKDLHCAKWFYTLFSLFSAVEHESNFNMASRKNAQIYISEN